jgi:CBS domain-containing protein
MKTNIIVKEAMNTNLTIVESKASVLEAAQRMKINKIGNVLIIENGRPIGILTESDILKKVVAEDKNARDVLVKDVMSTPIIVIDPYISLEEAMKTMGRCNIRRLPVVEKGEFIGMITQKDISRISPVLHEISREWYDIAVRDEAHYQQQIFSGKCEDCAILTTNLRLVDGRLLCEDCIDALHYEA